MAGRVWRWVLLGLVLGLVPLGLAYGVRYYYGSGAPALTDVLGTGDGLLVVVTWCATALVELAGTRQSVLRECLATAAAVVLVLGAVAFGCRTADSVTGRVQTPKQARVLTIGTVWGLAVGAAISTTATALAAVREEDTT